MTCLPSVDDFLGVIAVILCETAVLMRLIHMVVDLCLSRSKVVGAMSKVFLPFWASLFGEKMFDCAAGRATSDLF